MPKGERTRVRAVIRYKPDMFTDGATLVRPVGLPPFVSVRCGYDADLWIDTFEECQALIDLLRVARDMLPNE